MKKSIKLFAASVVFTMVPYASVFADASDTVKLNVTETCIIERLAYASGGTGDSSSHKNGTSATWSGNTLTSSGLSGGSTIANLGSSRFNVVCNSTSSKKMTVATTSLVLSGNNNYSIPNITDYSSTKSGWAPQYGSTKLTNGSTVYTVSTQTAGTPIEITYGAGVTTAQAAGSYSGTATYSITDV